MSSMFGSQTIFNRDISAWDVSSVTNMRGMFNAAASFNGDISSWDVSSVTDMSGMFGGLNPTITLQGIPAFSMEIFLLGMCQV